MNDILQEFNKYCILENFIQESGIDDEILKKAIDNVLKKYALPSVKLVPKKWGVANPTDTFLYGYPRYIEGEIPVAKDESGHLRQMRFIAQINCKDLTSLPDFPHSGLLQFWAETCDVSLGYDKHNDGRIKVVYIPNPSLSKNNISNVKIDESIYDGHTWVPGGKYYSVVDFPYVIFDGYNHTDNMFVEAKTEKSNPNISDEEIFLKLLKKEIKDLGSDEELDAQSFKLLDNDPKLKPVFGNRMGGYPSFTTDCYCKTRSEDNYEVLLLQLENSSEVFWGRDVTFGDNAVIGFYTSSDRLRSKDFKYVEILWEQYSY
jgi:uncharacterized protein YwqG